MTTARDERPWSAAIARPAWQTGPHDGTVETDDILTELHGEYPSACSENRSESCFEQMPRLSVAEKLEEYIHAAVTAAPPLTDQQRAQLATLLRSA